MFIVVVFFMCVVSVVVVCKISFKFNASSVCFRRYFKMYVFVLLLLYFMVLLIFMCG